MQNRSIKYTLVNATMDFSLADTDEGKRPAYVLDLSQADGDNRVTKHTIALTPDMLHALCAMMQRMLHREGYAVPEPPKTLITKH